MPLGPSGCIGAKALSKHHAARLCVQLTATADACCAPPYGCAHPFSYVTTKGGNKVAVYRDALNRVWMVDQAGDVFMDTGDPDVGVFAVSPYTGRE